MLVENTAQGAASWPSTVWHTGLSGTGRRCFSTRARATSWRTMPTDWAYRFTRPMTIVLSHGHYDHTGGLAEALKTNRHVTVYAHPAAFAPKYARKTNGSASEDRNASPGRKSHSIAAQPSGLHRSTDPRRRSAYGHRPRAQADGFRGHGRAVLLGPGLHQAGPARRRPVGFLRHRGRDRRAPGLRHSGVINTLQYIRQLTGDRPIRAVIGGMHLGDASPERIGRTIEELRRIGVQQLAPGHCTGMPATVALWTAFPTICVACHAGKTFEFEVT